MYEITPFICGHPKYGTPDNPASIYDDCPVCGRFYCHYCNLDKHECGGCGEPYNHGEEPHPGVSCV